MKRSSMVIIELEGLEDGLKSYIEQPMESGGKDGSDRSTCFPLFSFSVEMSNAAVSEVIYSLMSAEFTGYSW